MIGRRESDRLKQAIAKSREVLNMVRLSAVERSVPEKLVTGIEAATDLENARKASGHTMVAWIRARKAATTAWVAARKDDTLHAWVKQQPEVVAASQAAVNSNVGAASEEMQS